MKTILGVAVLWMLFCCAAGAQDNLVTAQNPPNGNVRSADRHQAPIGHRQPRQQDLPSDVRRREGTGSAMHGISTDSSTFVAAAEILHSNYAQAAARVHYFRECRMQRRNGELCGTPMTKALPS